MERPFAPKINLVSTTHKYANGKKNHTYTPNTALQLVHHISIRLVFKTCHECNTKCHNDILLVATRFLQDDYVEGSIIDCLRDYAPNLGKYKAVQVFIVKGKLDKEDCKLFGNLDP
jgi:hypothetical protein